MAVRKFSELSLLGQLATIGGMVSAIWAVVGSFAIWAADTKINEKYATDEDLANVQQRVEIEVTTITTTVETNTRTVARVAKSVDALTLSILDIGIKDTSDELYAMEKNKRSQGAAWNEREEATLRDRQQHLADLQAQRNLIFKRLLENSN